MSNAIRFLAWTGQVEEAPAWWSRLQPIIPQDNNDRLKKVEAAAVLGEDEDIYELLQPLAKAGAAPVEAAPGDSRQIQLFLAVAEANTNARAIDMPSNRVSPVFPLSIN